MSYWNVANLIATVRSLVPQHPEILKMDLPIELYSIKEVADLQPSLLVAAYVLKAVQKEYR